YDLIHGLPYYPTGKMIPGDSNPFGNTDKFLFIIAHLLLLAEIAGRSGEVVQRYAVFKRNERDVVIRVRFCCHSRIILTSDRNDLCKIIAQAFVANIEIRAADAAQHQGFIDIQYISLQHIGLFPQGVLAVFVVIVVRTDDDFLFYGVISDNSLIDFSKVLLLFWRPLRKLVIDSLYIRILIITHRLQYLLGIRIDVIQPFDIVPGLLFLLIEQSYP